MFASLDNFYVFMKQFFTDAHTYRLLKDRKNVFDQRDNFDKLKDEVKGFIKILKITLNETHFNLIFCLNWIEYLVRCRNYVLREYVIQKGDFGM